jgi:hypothetical protein
MTLHWMSTVSHAAVQRRKQQLCLKFASALSPSGTSAAAPYARHDAALVQGLFSDSCTAHILIFQPLMMHFWSIV